VASSEEGRREAEVFALVRSHPHPNVLRLHTITIEPKGDRTVLLQTVDFYPRNLYQYLTDLAENNVPAEQRARERKLILFQVLNGLSFLHRHQITHRNLTPAGVLLGDSLHTVLAGFSSLDSPRLALRTGLKCEWLIRPPEIVMQPRFPYGSAGDVWEFGCLVVFMLRGRMPFEEYSDSGLVVEMSKCIGRPSREDRNAIGLAEPHKFIFPHFLRESIGKVPPPRRRASNARSRTWWTC
jgi:serine/threonine protein kinase